MNDDKMTVFYNKRLGIVKEACGGAQGFDWFGDEAEDYAEIYDYIIVDYDPLLFNSMHQFYVEDEQLKMKQQSIPEQYL